MQGLTYLGLMYAPTDYDFGDKSNYEFATKITCANDEARKMFVEAFGHMLNYNHEQAIACFMACTESDPNCAMAWWGSLTAFPQTTIGLQDLVLDTTLSNKLSVSWITAQNLSRT